jgi:hypothetical protein
VSGTVQIRIYDVRRDRLDEWIAVFHERIVPLRRELGFEIQGSWVDRARSQHIWVIAHRGDQSAFEEANAAYWNSTKRAELDVDPEEFLTAEETRTVDSLL